MSAQATLGVASIPDQRAADQGRGVHVLLVRLAWLALGATATGLLVVGAPGYLERLASVCQGPPCRPGELTPESLPSLTAAGLSPAHYAAWIVLVNLAAAAVFAAVGGLLVWHRPGERMAQFTAFTLLLFAGPLTFAQFVAQAHPALWLLATVFDVVGACAFTALVFVFPDGRFVPGWTRWVAAVWIALQAAMPVFPTGSGPIRDALEPLNVPVFVVGLVSAAYAQVHRYRRLSTATQRQQTKWIAFGFASGLGLFAAAGLAQAVVPSLRDPVPILVLATVAYAGVTLLPLSMAVALLRHGLFDVDALIGRTLVYAALTASIVAVYVLVVGYLGSLFRTHENLLISLVATGAVAVLFQPLRQRLQRAVNQLLYGQRHEPYAALATLGRQLDDTGDAATMRLAAETIAHALKLPYAAIRAVRTDGSMTEVAAVGSPSVTAEPLRVPLLHRGERVGELVLGRRGRGEPFGPADLRLLGDLARQAAAALHAVRLATELQHARARLVSAREEERRRLRRDLHDGLGPTLAGLGLKLEAARNLLGQDPRADAVLADVAEQAQAAVGDIRRLVYALRPPALDERGLVGALRQTAATLETHAAPSGLRITIVAPDPLPPLPAAVEVAAYRIAQEALTNVARHARARHCTVRLLLGSGATTLDLTIEDDGIGLPERRVAGVGMASMRERAEELGGSLVVEPRAGGGTCVTAFLPLPAGDERPPAAESASVEGAA